MKPLSVSFVKRRGSLQNWTFKLLFLSITWSLSCLFISYQKDINLLLGKECMGAKDCPVEFAVNILSSKWATLIVRDLMDGPKRFGQLQDSLDSISSKVLNQTLKHLMSHNVISKKIYPVSPPRVEYKLTEYGKQLEDVIEALKLWGSIRPVNVYNID